MFLDLPEEPKQLFAAVEPVFSEFFTPEGYRIGGGTVLAGRWGHRHSTDVDLFAEPTWYQEVVDRRGEELERALLERAPGVDPERSWVEPQHIYLAVGDSEVTMLPAVWIHRTPEEPVRIRNTRVAAESVEEILGKKLRLRMIGEGAYLIRDLYDIAAAEIEDPDALRRALAAEPPRRLQQLAQELRSLGAFEGELIRPAFPWTHSRIQRAVIRLCEEAAARHATPKAGAGGERPGEPEAQE